MINPDFKPIAVNAGRLSQWLLLISLVLGTLTLGLSLGWFVAPAVVLQAAFTGVTDGLGRLQSFGIVAVLVVQIALLGITALSLRRLFECFLQAEFTATIGAAAGRVRFWIWVALGWSVVVPVFQSVLASPGLFQGEIQVSVGLTQFHLVGLLMAVLSTFMANLVCLLASLWQEFEATV